MFIIELRYNAHSDWMKNHVLCSAFFLRTRKAVSYKIVFRGIQRRFSSSRRSAKCPVFKFNQGNKFLKTFQVHFFLLYSPENSFKK